MNKLQRPIILDAMNIALQLRELDKRLIDMLPKLPNETHDLILDANTARLKLIDKLMHAHADTASEVS